MSLNTEPMLKINSYYLIQGIRNRLSLARGLILKTYLLFFGCKVGRKLKCKKWPLFRVIPKKNIIIGDNVNIGYYITFAADKNGRIILEDHVNLTQNVLISSCKEVKIGSHTLVAENVSIRDGEHSVSAAMLISHQNLTATPISIGRDVWIGSGSIILKGAF